MAHLRSHIVGTLLAVIAIAAALLAPATAQAAEVDLHARLHPGAAYPRAYGGASYESDHDGREMSVTVRGVKALAGKRLTVRVHGSLVGQMRVSALGIAHLHRHSGVPACSAGDMVRVRTAAGVLVVSGRLRADREHED